MNITGIIASVSRRDKDDDIDRRSSRKATHVSARKLVAGLWRLQPPESPIKTSRDLSGLPKSNGLEFQLGSAMEGATKWDRGSQGLTSRVPGLKLELGQAQAEIHRLKTARRSSKKKLERFLKKLEKEQSIWRRREHEKVRLVIDDVKHRLNREKINQNQLKVVNSKLLTKLAETTKSAKRYMQDYEKERKARELMEEICDELAKEIGEDKAEIERVKREMIKMREEVDAEKKMLQMEEVWREERMQMKLVDAKVTLEEKYSHMNKLVKELEAFLISKGVNLDYEEMIQRSAGSINVMNPEIVYFDEDDDESGWETVSHVGGQGLSHSAKSVSETSEVGLVRSKQGKKVLSLDHGSGKSGVTSPDWGPESRDHQRVKGCVEWSSGLVQKNSLKAKLLEARMESQKVQSRQALKQKI